MRVIFPLCQRRLFFNFQTSFVSNYAMTMRHSCDRAFNVIIKIMKAGPIILNGNNYVILMTLQSQRHYLINQRLRLSM